MKPACTVLLPLLAAAVTVYGQIPNGAQFEVNTYTTGNQFVSGVATAPDGGFVVVWQSGDLVIPGPDGSGSSIQGQRFDPGGSAAGGEFQINSFTLDSQQAPVVTVDGAGNFVVAWESRGSSGSDTDGMSIQAQRFAANGDPLGDEFQVNSFTTGDQARPKIGSAADGRFLVVWANYGGSQLGIKARRYSAAGAPLGDELEVNANLGEFVQLPALAVEPDGDFVVAWQSLPTPSEYGYTIDARRFASTGAPVGDPFRVNSDATADHQYPAVAAAADGSFVVVWTSDASTGSDHSGYSVQGRRFGPSGGLGNQFQINALTSGDQVARSVARTPDGGFVVAWVNRGATGSDDSGSIRGRRFGSSGSPFGADFQINSYTPGYQAGPRLAAGSGGDFVAVWSSDGSGSSDIDGFSVQGQRYRSSVIFAAGFESGDTSAWSSSSP